MLNERRGAIGRLERPLDGLGARATARRQQGEREEQREETFRGVSQEDDGSAGGRVLG